MLRLYIYRFIKIYIGTSCLSFEEPTRDPTSWPYNNADISWNQTPARDPDVWPPLSAAEQK